MNPLSLPLHPLVVHAAVVLVPVFAIAAALWAIIPRWGWWLRWPVLIGSFASVVIVLITRATGDQLKQETGMRGTAVDHHDQMSGLLLASTGVLVVAALLAWFTLPINSPIPGGAQKAGRWPMLGIVARVLLVLAAVAVGVTVYLTGDSGAGMVWRR